MQKRNESLQAKKNNRTVIERLVEHSIRGDREALVSLCHEIARSVLFSTMYSVNNQMDAEDVAQEVLIKVCENIHTLNNPKAFRAWLNTITENEIRRYFAKNSKNSTVINLDEYLNNNDFEEDDDDILPYEYTIKEEDRQIVMEIIHTLPERQKKAIFLYYYECLNVSETARAMDISQSTVSHYLNLARDKIRSEIQSLSLKTGTLFGISYLPIGGLLANVLQQEAGQISSLNDSLLNEVVSKRVEQLGTKTTAKIVGVSLGFIKTTVITVVAALAIAAGLWIGGVFKDPHSFLLDNAQPIETHGDIVFSGGDPRLTYINPTHIIVYADNERGSLTPISWMIVADNGESRYEGKGDNVDGTLEQMHQNGETGIFEISYLLEDSEGITYTISRQFKLS